MPETSRAPAFAALLAKVEGLPEPMLRLAGLMRKDGHAEQAEAVARRAVALAPDDPRIKVLGRTFFSKDVPTWHFSLVRDTVRNAAYDAALRRAIRPGMRVLEIGTGSGILAMMAARAGAAEVVTCEMNPTVAETARKIIARNGFGERVRVIGKHSGALDADADLGGRMDLLVSEIVSNDLLAEDVLPAHERAMRDLLKPGAPVIPARGSIRVALAFAEFGGEKNVPVTTVDGFDLSPMEEWRAPAWVVKSRSDKVVLRSTPADLFTFAFAATKHTAAESRSASCRATGGPANGVVQWIHLAVDDVTPYENGPECGHYSCWAMRFYPFDTPIETRDGATFTIHGMHDRHDVKVWLGA